MFSKLTNKQKYQEGKKKYNLVNFVIDNEDVPYKNFTSFIPIKLDYGTPTYLEFNPVKENQSMVTHGRSIEIIDDEEKKIQRKKYREEVYSASYRSDGELFVCGDAAGRVRIVRTKGTAKETAPLREFDAHKGPVQSAKFLNDTQIITASDDKTAHIYDYLTETRVATFVGHTDYVRTCAGFGDLVFTGGYDHEMRIWDIRDPTKPVHIHKLSAPIQAIAPHHLTVHVAHGSSLSSLSLLTHTPVITVHHTNTITSLWINKKGDRLVSGGLDRVVRVWDEGDTLHTMSFDHAVLSCAVSYDEKQIMIGLANKTILKSRRRDPLVHKLKISHDELTTENYRNMVNGYLTEQMIRIRDSVMLPRGRSTHLEEFRDLLKRYQYKRCLDKAFSHQYIDNPLVPLSLLQELMTRNELLNALDARDNRSLKPTLEFLNRYIRDARYNKMVIPVAVEVLRIYGCIIGKDEEIDRLFRTLRRRVNQECEVMRNMSELKGILDTLISASLLHISQAA
jgi:U3 small nucleolar RNA-associated protein 15